MHLTRKERRTKALILALLTTVVANLLLLRSRPIFSYVDSIYTHIPLIFWAVSGAVFCIAAVAFISLAMRRRDAVCLAAVIILNNAVILLAPYICGIYLMNGSDLPTHGSMVLDIIDKHGIDFNLNFYPTTHILTYAVSATAGTDHMLTLRNLAPCFSLILPLYFFVLARFAGNAATTGRYAFVLASGFYLSSLFQPNSITTPNGLSALFLPFVAWLVLSHLKNKLAFFAALIVAMTSLVFFHPITSFVLIGSLLLFTGICRLYHEKSPRTGMFYFTIAFGGYVLFLTAIWAPTAVNVGNFLSGYNVAPGYAVDIGENIAKLNLDPSGLVILFLKMFGHQSILLLISLSFVLSIAARAARTRRISIKHHWWLILLACISAMGVIIMLIALTVPTLFNVSFFRFLEYALIFTPLLAAVPLARYSRSQHGRILTAALVCLLFISSMLVLYPSPYIDQANTQVTYADLAGAQWILDSRDRSVGLSGFFGVDMTTRLVSSLIPYSDFLAEGRSTWLSNAAPNHLGYDGNMTLLNTFGERRYLILTEFDLVTYHGVYSKIGRLSSEDVTKAESDYTANLIYDSGSYQVFYIVN